MRTLRHLALALGWACALTASALVLLYVQPEAQASTAWVAMAASFIPYGIVLWLAATVLFLLGGTRWSRLLAFPTLVALIVQVGWVRPYWPIRTTPEPGGAPVRVLAANVRFGGADPASFARVVAEADADVVVVTEATEPFLGSEDVADALAGHPWTVGRAASGPQAERDPSGTVVFSRLPLAERGRVPSRFDQYVVEVSAPGTPLVLVAAHPANMLGSASTWEREGAILRDAIRPHLTEPLAVVGDLNATAEHLTLRMLLAEGLTLGSQEAGAGWQPTFTSLPFGPPLIAIDHVLTNEHVTTRSFRTAPLEGSDHAVVVADLVVR